MRTRIIDDKDLLQRLARTSDVDFGSISASEYRYKVAELKPYLSEEAFIWYKAAVEVGIVQAFSRRGAIPQSFVEEIRRAAEAVTAKEVYAEEDKTGHDIIALVNMLKEKVGEGAKSVVHRAATSYDTIDTANALRYRDAFDRVIIPDTARLLKAWIAIVRDESETLQIGRTHLQHGEPITFGFSMAWFVDRLGGRMLEMQRASDALVGKFSGAVGAYNAASLFVPDPIAFEGEVLRQVGTAQADISTQIVQPEFLGDLVHFTISGFGILANWAHDMRNLMRPEIGEVWLPRGKDVSRSSTMPHKANPVGFENIQSLWKEAVPRMMTMYMDQISENGRDLTNSASQRYTPEIFDIFDYSVRRAIRVAEKLRANPENMRKNFDMNSNTITAEPLQLILSSLGRHSAHSDVGRLADIAKKEGRSVIDLAKEDPELAPYMAQLSEGQSAVLSDPSGYTGEARAKALEIADKWERKIDALGL